MMKRVEANYAGAIDVLGSWYYYGKVGFQQGEEKRKPEIMDTGRKSWV